MLIIGDNPGVTDLTPLGNLSELRYLEYFMMNDVKRSDDYSPDTFVIASNYSQDHPHPEYTADDDYFFLLWKGVCCDGFDPETHTVFCRDRYNDDAETWTFSYASFQ